MDTAKWLAEMEVFNDRLKTALEAEDLAYQLLDDAVRHGSADVEARRAEFVAAIEARHAVDERRERIVRQLG